MTDWKNTKCGTCKWQRTSVICTGCNEFDKYIPMTNSMKIKLMSDEELAENISCPHVATECIHLDDDIECEQCKLQWLQLGVKE